MKVDPINSFDEAVAFALTLPDTELSTSYGKPAVKVASSQAESVMSPRPSGGPDGRARWGESHTHHRDLPPQAREPHQAPHRDRFLSGIPPSSQPAGSRSAHPYQRSHSQGSAQRNSRSKEEDGDQDVSNQVVLVQWLVGQLTLALVPATDV